MEGQGNSSCAGKASLSSKSCRNFTSSGAARVLLPRRKEGSKREEERVIETPIERDLEEIRGKEKRAERERPTGKRVREREQKRKREKTEK
eukprot:scaffold59565_cov23-Tisochrysis_lutea.AAC.6